MRMKRGRWNDPRRWVLVVTVLAVAGADLLLPPNVVLLSLLVIPIVSSAFFADIAFTTAQTAFTVGMTAAISLHQQYPVPQTAVRMATLLVAGLAAAVLARRLREQQRVLTATSEGFQLLAENGSDVVFRATPDLLVTWISPSVRTALGWESEAILGRAMTDLVHPDDRGGAERMRELVHDGPTGGQPRGGLVARIRHEDGSFGWMSVRLTTVRGPDDAMAVVGSLTNVNDLVAARAVAESHEELLRVAADAALEPQAVAQAIRDAAGQIVDFRYLDVNAAACRYLGHGKADLLATTFDERMRGGFRETALFASYVRCVEDGTPVQEDAHRWEAADGSTRFVDLRGARLSGDRIALTWRDVTDRHEAAERLAASEARYRLLVENTTDVVLMVDNDGIIRWASPSAESTLRWMPEQLVGRRNTEFLHPDELAAVSARMREVASSGADANIVARFRCGDDTYRWTESTGRQVVPAEGGGPSRVVRLRDVTLEVEQRQALADSERRFRLLAENASDVVVLLQEGHVRWASPSIRDALGWSVSDWEGGRFDAFVHPDDKGDALQFYVRSAAGSSTLTRLRMRDAKGAWRWTEVHSGPFVDGAGSAHGVVASFRVIDLVIEAERELERRALFDELTGTVKRRGALERLHAIQASERVPGAETAVLFLDVDEFKRVNDTLGHAAGDAVLTALTHRMRTVIRGGDVIARMGGDEFLVLLADVHGLFDAVAIAEKIRSAMEVPVPTMAGEAKATVSIGVTLIRDGESVDDVIARADAAMYSAKARGRNRVTPIDADDSWQVGSVAATE